MGPCEWARWAPPWARGRQSRRRAHGTKPSLALHREDAPFRPTPPMGHLHHRRRFGVRAGRARRRRRRPWRRPGRSHRAWRRCSRGCRPRVCWLMVSASAISGLALPWATCASTSSSRADSPPDSSCASPVTACNEARSGSAPSAENVSRALSSSADVRSPRARQPRPSSTTALAVS